jgi:hypothetical protein
MNALGAPAAAGTRENGPFTPDRRDWLRLVGGMMFAAGAVVLLIRKNGDWSDWAFVAGFLIPSVVLFAIAVPAARSRWGLQGWQSAYLVFATLLLLGALLELVSALDGNPGNSLNLLWTFGVVAVVAAGTALALRAPFQMLLAALAGVVVWLALWDKILSNPSGDTVRWLLLALAAIYLVAGVALARAAKPQAPDLITVAGLAAVLAGALSFAAAAGAASPALGSSLAGDAPKPGQGWNLFLLVISLVLIAYGSRAATRGPAYVGALGLTLFILLTGADLVSRLNGDAGGGVVGWPLILLIVGAVAMVLSFVLKPGTLGGSSGTTAPAGGRGPEAGTQVLPGQPGTAAQPAAQPAAPPQPAPGQPGSLLDQWRHQPPPGGAPPQG